MTDRPNPYTPPPASQSTRPPFNPYAPPKTTIGAGAVGEVENADAIRRQYLSHEASLRSVGCLYYVGGIFLLVCAGFLGITFLVVGLSEGTDSFGILLGALGVGFYLLLGSLNVWVGKGLRQLHEKVRVTLTILSILSLIGFPLGTLIGAYILYLLHSEKGKFVLSESYRRVVAATPHIKYQTSPWVWALLVTIVVGLVVLAFLGST